MTSQQTRNRTLRLAVVGALALVGVLGSATQASAAGLKPIDRSTIQISPVTPPLPPDDPEPGCDPDVMLCADPAADPDADDPTPVPEPECPEIPTAGGATVPDPACEPDCPEIPPATVAVVRDDCPPPECPEDEPTREPRREPVRELGPARPEPCDPPEVDCAVIGPRSTRTT